MGCAQCAPKLCTENQSLNLYAAADRAAEHRDFQISFQERVLCNVYPRARQHREEDRALRCEKAVCEDGVEPLRPSSPVLKLPMPSSRRATILATSPIPRIGSGTNAGKVTRSPSPARRPKSAAEDVSRLQADAINSRQAIPLSPVLRSSGQGAGFARIGGTSDS